MNHYATHPVHGRGGRALQLQNALQLLGHRMLVVHASFHHLMLHPEAKAPSDWISVATPSYKGNGLGRLRNVVGFARGFRSLEAHCVHQGIPKPDVVVYSSPHPFAWRAVRTMCTRMGVPAVLEVRDLWPESLVQILNLSRWNPLVLFMAAWERSMVQSADGFLSLLEHCDRYYVNKGLRVPPFCWISNGADIASNIEELPLDIAKAWAGLRSRGKRVLLYAGSLGSPNGLLEFLRLEIPQPLKDKLQLVLVGAGNERERIAARIAEPGMEWVSLLPAVSSDLADTMIRNADGCFLYVKDLPLYEYGISMNKLFQYAAAAKPVVAVLPKGQGLVRQPWFLHASHDAGDILEMLQRFLELPDSELQRRGKTAQAWVAAEYDWDAMAQRLLDFVSDLSVAAR